MSRSRFDGKVALVTGSSRGIGRAIALRLARDGADVVVNYRQRGEDARLVAEEIQRLGTHAVAIEANMADPAAISALFARIESEFGGLDILVCNAAAGHQGTMGEATVKAWELAMNVNARSYLLCAQAAFPMMERRGGGRILVTTARIATERAFPHYGTVAASKAAVNTLTTYLAVEFGRAGITVNAISPGLVDTDALAYFRKGPELLDRARSLTPSGRVTTVEDIASMAAYLCSEEAGQVNGQIIEVDGGYTRLFL